MAAKGVFYHELLKLKRTILILQKEFSDYRDNQIEVNAKFDAHLSTWSLREKQLRLSIKCINRLRKKVIENDIRMDTLMKVMGGRIEKEVCRCGATLPVFQQWNLNKERKRKSKRKKTDSESESERTFTSQECQTTQETFRVYSRALRHQSEENQSIDILLPGTTWLFNASPKCHLPVNIGNETINRETLLWRGIIQGNEASFLPGKLIQLGDDLIIGITLVTVDEEEFAVCVYAPDNEHNRGLHLGREIGVDLGILSTDGGSMEQFSHLFRVDALYPARGQPDTFRIAITDKLNQRERPNMIFIFN